MVIFIFGELFLISTVNQMCYSNLWIVTQSFTEAGKAVNWLPSLMSHFTAWCSLSFIKLLVHSWVILILSIQQVQRLKQTGFSLSKDKGQVFHTKQLFSSLSFLSLTHTNASPVCLGQDCYQWIHVIWAALGKHQHQWLC